MKKALYYLIVLCVIISCFSFGIAEDNKSPASAEDGAATSGVDVIVVLDMSASMYNNGTVVGNDDNGYRLDATAMLVGMLDLDGSRIGVVPFGGRVLSDMNIALKEPGSKWERQEYIDKIYHLRPIKNGTNIGGALMQALYMLDSREDKTNSPMIVLMTDGQNDIPKEDNVSFSPAYRWNAESGFEVHNEAYKYDTERANEVTSEAVNCAESLGIPIYTVALSVDPMAQQKGTMSLSEISQRTGVGKEGILYAKDKNDAKRIPRYFAEILANKIGSSVQEKAHPRRVTPDGNTYEIKVPVLNSSIREINVFLPVKKYSNAKVERNFTDISGIIKTSIKVLNGDGKALSDADGVNVLYDAGQQGAFATIKIQNPQSTGKMWTLQFDSVDSPDDVEFNFLYNYSIKLRTEVQNSGDLYKSGTLRVNTYFVETTSNGQEYKSEDPTLYLNHDQDPDFSEYNWVTIRTECQLYGYDREGRLMEAPLLPVSGEEWMTLDEGELDFHTDINLAELFPEIKAGNYLLRVKAEGAGLKRQLDLPIMLNNHVPETISGNEYKPGDIIVNKSEEAAQADHPAGASWTVSGTSGNLEKTTWELVTDGDVTDLEKLHQSYKLVPVEGIDQAAELRLSGDLKTISLETKEDENGGIRAGQVRYQLNYDDGDGGNGSMLISLDILSDDAKLKSAYDPEWIITGSPAEGTAEADHTYRKNTPVKVSLRLKQKDGQGYADKAVFGNLYANLDIRDRDGNPVKVDGNPIVISDPEVTKEGWEWNITTTGNQAAEWIAKVRLGTYEIAPITIRIPNQTPPVAKVGEVVTINCSGDKIPEFLQTLIGGETKPADPVRNITQTRLFEDSDGDLLEYSQPIFKDNTGKEIKDAELIKVEDGETEGSYRITASGKATSLFSYSYDCTMEITAVDGDQESATYVQRITIVDLYKKLLTWVLSVVIAIVVLVILILIIHQIRKPVFPKLNLTIREEPSLYETCSEPLSPVKKPTNANAMGVDSDMAAKHGLSLALLQNIIIKPIRSSLAVGVISNKTFPGQEVLLDDVALKAKKLYTWRVGQELTIRSDRGEGMVVIKLEDRLEDSGTDLDDFGGSDDWAEVSGDGMEKPNGKKRSRKVERKQKQAEEPAESNTDDDFDF